MGWYGIALASEGPTDIGELHNPGADWVQQQDGFLQNLIGRCLTDHDVQFFDGLSLYFDFDPGDSVGGPLQVKATRASVLAAYHRCHAVVYIVDSDNDDDPRSHRLDPIVRGLNSGLGIVDGPQPVPIVALAVKTIEAWVMGDHDAVSSAAGDRFVGPIPTHPEMLWGTPSDPASNHPKQVLRRIFGGHINRADYAAVGANAKPDSVSARCPTGFEPFRDQLTAACP